MELNVISNIISGEVAISDLDIVELEHLANKYPYSQIFTIIYLKVAAKKEPFEFNQILEKYAYRVTDRMRLYEIIHSENTYKLESLAEEQEPVKVVNEVVEQISVDVTEEKVKEQVEMPSPESENQEVEDFEIKSDSEIEEVEAEPVQEILISEVNHIEDTTEEEIASTGEEVREEVRLDENVNIEVSVQNEEEEELLPSESLHLEDVEEVTSTELEEDTAIQGVASEQEIERNREDEMLEKIILSSVAGNAYLKQLENETKHEIKEELQEESLEIEEPQEEIQNESQEEISPVVVTKEDNEEGNSLDNSLGSFLDWLNKDVNSEPQISEQLVEEFAQPNPKITERKEFYSPAKMAQESLNKDSLIYSETLANIFELQGNFSQAIEAYEQLSLSNPKKRIIFAKKIGVLKEKLSNLK